MAYASAAPSAPRTRAVGALSLKAACEAARLGQPGRKAVLGTWQMFPGPGLARIIASMGFDWMLIDMEHGAIGDTEMHAMVPAIAGTGCVPLVRVPAPEMAYIKRALDAGAHGLMFPMIETAEQAQQIVKMCKFPPTGMRGVGSPFAPAIFQQNLADYTHGAYDSTMVIVQIETPTGVKNAQEIASVPGIDMLFVGPVDLCASMGFGVRNPAEVPEVQEAIESVRKAADAAGKLAGMFAGNAESAKERFKQGFQLMNVGGDMNAVAFWRRWQGVTYLKWTERFFQ